MLDFVSPDFPNKSGRGKKVMQARSEWDDHGAKSTTTPRLTKLETICEREHQKSHGEARS